MFLQSLRVPNIKVPKNTIELAPNEFKMLKIQRLS